MTNADFLQQAQLWANDVLVWVGFGTIVGLLAKAIMPGRDPGGPVATLCMGIGGTVIGCGSLMFFAKSVHVTPISPLGFVVATAGSFVLLGFYRLLAGRLFTEQGEGLQQRFQLRRPGRRVRAVREVGAVYED